MTDLKRLEKHANLMKLPAGKQKTYYGKFLTKQRQLRIRRRHRHKKRHPVAWWQKAHAHRAEQKRVTLERYSDIKLLEKLEPLPKNKIKMLHVLKDWRYPLGKVAIQRCTHSIQNYTIHRLRVYKQKEDKKQ